MAKPIIAITFLLTLFHTGGIIFINATILSNIHTIAICILL